MSRSLKACLTIGLLALVSPWAAAQTEEANAVLGKAGSSVLALVSYGADKTEILKGSGFALGEDVVVTAYPIVSRANDVEGLNIKGKKVKFEGVIGVDKAHGIALLKLKGKLTALPVGPADDPAAGARLYALGSNESGQVIIYEGAFRKAVDMGPEGKIYEITMPCPSQFSGGPLVDANGQLVGLLFMGDFGLMFGLPVQTIANISRAGKATEFKAQTPENYFETIEGSTFAGRAAVALDQQMTARQYFEKAAKLDPSDAGNLMTLAGIYAQQRDYSQAAATYKKVTELDPGRADAFNGLGVILLKQTQYRDAAAALEKAASLGYSGQQLQMDLGSAYEAVPDFAKAAAAYEKYIAQATPDAWAAQLRLGFCRTKLGEYDAAIAALLEAEKARPKEIKVRDALATAYVEAQRFEDAEAVYNAMAELNPNEAMGYYRQTYQMYDKAGRFDRAVEPLKKIIALDPKNETNFYYLGMTYFKVPDYDKAVAAFEQALAVKPDFPHAWYQIGSSYFNAKKFKEAAEAYKKYSELAPEDPSGPLNVGVAYLQGKNYEAALEPLKKAVELTPASGVALVNLAVVYINLKDMYSAKDVYNKLLSVDPSLAEKIKKYIR